MKSHFSLLVRFFLAWLLTFLVGKLAFFVHNGWPGFADALQIYWHGLPLDIAVAAYLTAPLWLVLTCATLLGKPRFTPGGRTAYRVYSATVGILILATLIVTARAVRVSPRRIRCNAPCTPSVYCSSAHCFSSVSAAE